jgi:hypothetical protein
MHVSLLLTLNLPGWWFGACTKSAHDLQKKHIADVFAHALVIFLRTARANRILLG